jgi:hypothetical protein
VGELREVTAELLVWSARAEEGCSGGSAAASSSSELRQSAALFWHFGAGSERKSERNRMLGFSKCWGVRELGSWGATASHPRRQRGGVEAVGNSSVTRGCQRKQEVAGGPAQSGGRHCAGEQGSRGVGWRWKKVDRFAISKNSRDHTVR